MHQYILEGYFLPYGDFTLIQETEQIQGQEF